MFQPFFLFATRSFNAFRRTSFPPYSSHFFFLLALFTLFSRSYKEASFSMNETTTLSERLMIFDLKPSPSLPSRRTSLFPNLHLL